MQRRVRDLLRTFLPLLPLGLCGAYGVSNESASAAPSAPADVAAVPNNAPPTIEIAAVEDAQVGAAFDYLPMAQDPESDTLQFTATNLPPWASLDSISGRIRGTPGPMDAGVYEAISITVADAMHKVVTAPFSITVNPALEPMLEPALELGSGVASLQWETPPSKVSGEPLDDLAGYRILYGRSSSDLDHSVLITNPATTSYQFSTLSPGVWYFAVVAVNANGLEGPPTTLASKSI
jgi:Putative Ig domain/Fibronectin type III domain